MIPEENLRGGTAILFKSYIWHEVNYLKPEHDQLWFKLHSLPNTKFGSIYIPPRDSPFFNPHSFATIQEHSHQEQIIILGDFNSRLGNLNTFHQNEIETNITYSENPDTTVNANGRDLANLCLMEKILPLNHMKLNNKNLHGNLTFRRQHNWISQLDWAFSSPSHLKHIESFEINQDTTLPTDHASLSLTLSGFCCPAQHVASSARQLGAYNSHQSSSKTTKLPKPIKHVDQETFLHLLRDPPILNQDDDLNIVCEELAHHIYSASYESRTKPARPHYQSPQNATQRWNNILNHNDEKQLWAAINWQGTLNTKILGNQNEPSDSTFCNHFQTLLNPDNILDPRDYIPPNYRYIPVLDDPIRLEEVVHCISKLKPNKAAGIDGISPGTLKLLPQVWLNYLTILFNMIFNQDYPLNWTLMKVITLFKKGARDDPGNYRGISIISSLPKVYDMILSNRFSLWYKPKPEQAGAQAGRGCEEQILSVRLIIDIARHTKKPLYIAFIDYQKAYDKVDRYKLIRYLDQKGCGNKFLHALQHSMTSTGQIGKEQFTTSAGVKQGGSSSCNSFTAYIDPTIEAVQNFGPDDWLGNLHILLLMDDTVVMATSRHNLLMKLNSLKQCADNLGMTMHPTKSQFFTVNVVDDEEIHVQDVTISKTNKYLYLGALLSNQAISNQIKDHINLKSTHVRKFYSFLSKNSDCPYPVKYKVWKSALNSSILYSCETWLTSDLRSIETPYNNTLKQMLGVRLTTCNDLIYSETGYPNAKTIILERQTNFLRKILAKTNYVTDLIQMAITRKSPMGRRIQTLMQQETPHKLAFIQNLQQTMTQAQTSRRLAYKDMNPDLKAYPALLNPNIPERNRIALTRIRLGSHHLKIETGRWSRIPADQRICSCNMEVQNEKHVLLFCPISLDLRKSMNLDHITSLQDLFSSDAINLAKYCRRVLELYQNL